MQPVVFLPERISDAGIDLLRGHCDLVLPWENGVARDHDEVRALLYEAANSLLTVVRKAHPLKDWARRVKKRTSHKKACVALARKLAVILHRMLITGEVFRWPQKEAAA